MSFVTLFYILVVYPSELIPFEAVFGGILTLSISCGISKLFTITSPVNACTTFHLYHILLYEYEIRKCHQLYDYDNIVYLVSYSYGQDPIDL